MNPTGSVRTCRRVARLSCVALLLGATAPAHAEIVQVIGASLRAHNPDGPQVVTVQATFLGDANSLYTSELYLDAPTFLGPIFNNHLTPVNSTAFLGTFQPETVLFIRNRSFFLDDPSDPGSPASYNFNFFTGDGTLPPNPDGLPHAVFSFDTDDPDGPVTVSFEDLIGGGDLDFNDAVYSFTHVRAALVDVAVTPMVNVTESRVFAPFQGNYSNNTPIENDGSIFNYGDGENAGQLDNFGSFFNDLPGTLSNTASGRIDNQGNFGNFGSLSNSGSIGNAGSFDNAGFLENFGSIVNGASGTVRNLVTGTIDNSGSIDNAGTLQNLGAMLNKFNGTLSNLTGTIDNPGNLVIQAGGSVINNAFFGNSGAIQNLGNLLNLETGLLSNSLGGMVENLLGGAIENSGTIENQGTLQNRGTLLNKANGTIINSTGFIENLGNVLIGAQSSVSGGGTFSQGDGSTQVDGTLGASLIDIAGGLISGSGVLQGDVRVGPGGTLAPGNSPGTLQIDGDLHLDGGRLAIELAALTMHDVLDISGAAILDGGFINYLFSFTPAAGDSFVFLTALGGITGLDSLSFNFFGDLGGLRFATLLDGDSLVLTVESAGTSVPEPGALWLVAAALLVLAIDARRRGWKRAR